MVWSKRVLPDCQRALVQRLCLGIQALLIIDDRQVVQGKGHIKRVWVYGLLVDSKSSFVQRFCLGIQASCLI